MADDALLHVCLQHAKRLLVPLHRHVKRLQHPLRREVVRHDPLLDLDRLGRHAKRLSVEPEVENQFFGRSGDAAEIRVQTNRVLVDDFDPLLLIRSRCGMWLVAIGFSSSVTMRFLSITWLLLGRQSRLPGRRPRRVCTSCCESTRSLRDRRSADHYRRMIRPPVRCHLSAAARQIFKITLSALVRGVR